MDQDLIAYFDARFRELSQQIAESREETIRRFEQVDKRFEQVDKRFEQVDNRLEQGDRRFGNLEETTRHIFVVVEDLRSQIQLIAERGDGLADKLERYHREAVITFNQVKGWIEPYFKDLNGRLLVLEKRAERQDKDSSGAAL